MAKKGTGKRSSSDACSFCGKRSEEVDRLIAGPPDVFICNECIDLCSSLLEDNRSRRPAGGGRRTVPPTPQEITAYLDQYIIGQERTKRVLSVAVYNHYKRLQHADESQARDVELEKSNILLIGPTGCGKTLFARCLSDLLNVPFAIGDATTITEAGYVGEDVENLLLRLLQSADYDIPAAETGILYIDEIDKVSKSSGNVSITRDVSGEGVQQSLLKLVEGTVANVPPTGGRKHPEQQYLQINTEHILFICGGAFSGLDEIIARRLGDQVVGFDIKGDRTEADLDAETKEHVFSQVTDEDLVGFGLIPELVGRLPVITNVSDLSEDDLVRILTEPHNSLVKQYQVLFAMDGAKLDFTDDALRSIARHSMERKTGARALRSIMEGVMLDIMYELPTRVDRQEEYRITRGVVDGTESVFVDAKAQPGRRDDGKQHKESA